MRIGLDVSGGDFAPQTTIDGAIMCLEDLVPDDIIVLLGNRKSIIAELHKRGVDAENFEIIDASQSIEMHEHPTKAFESKPQSSIVMGFRMLVESSLDGFASAGNTGAMLVGAMQMVKPVNGIIRPCIASVYPNIQGGFNLLLDVGFNPDAKPEMLFQFGQIGSVFARNVYSCTKPKVGLLNIGSESGKGNLLSKSAFNLLSANDKINFIGNVEGNQLFDSNVVDVIVTDGFTGNIVLKQAEGFYSLLMKQNLMNEYFKKYNFEFYGGTPVLGINKNVVIGHGRSSAFAVKNMILLTAKIAKVNLSKKINEFMNYEKNQSNH
ncbi:MAG TPA: phosphate acyltransferase PlsX [Bacteroidales bacterium]|nr:phosphate acyltransferase PlsX [Bacteroidales bacterium]HQP04618.1 phosphate acyltransferase PlsX [Bacteroidales bacterium]